MSKPNSCNTNSRKASEFEKREQAILAIALQRFCSDDYESATVAQIAQQVGIAKGTMYLHFASKHEIYARLTLDFYRALLLELRKPLSGKALDQLRQIINRAFQFHIERPAYYRVTRYCEREDFRRTLNDKISKELDDIDHHIEKTITAVMLSGIERDQLKAKPPQQLILGLQCTFQGALTRFWCNRHNEQLTAEQFVNTVTDYMLDTIIDNDKLTIEHGISEQPTHHCSPTPQPRAATEHRLEPST